jgi:hypothetical protein
MPLLQGGEVATIIGDTTYRMVAGPFFLPGVTVFVGKLACDFEILNSSALAVHLPNITIMFPFSNGSHSVTVCAAGDCAPPLF